MGQPEGAPLTEALARSVCAKAGAQAYLTGKISRDGSGYLVKLAAYQCAGAKRIASAGASAARADLVVQHLGEATRKLRQDLGGKFRVGAQIRCASRESHNADPRFPEGVRRSKKDDSGKRGPRCGVAL